MRLGRFPLPLFHLDRKNPKLSLETFFLSLFFLVFFLSIDSKKKRVFPMELFYERAEKHDKKTYGWQKRKRAKKAKIHKARHQNWCRNYDVKQISFRLWQAASAIAKKRERKNHINKETEKERERVRGEREIERKSTRGRKESEKEREKNHSFLYKCSVRDVFVLLLCFLLCADFIDYMKRIQIAAQEYNIRFLNPIVGTPEKPACIYFYYSFLVSCFFSHSLLVFGGFLLKYKKATIGERKVYFFYRCWIWNFSSTLSFQQFICSSGGKKQQQQ